MAKIEKQFKANLVKNEEKGGAWIATTELYERQNDGLGNKPWVLMNTMLTAWTNASAGKRHIKERVRALTTRKSIKLIVKVVDANNKPTRISGEIEFKAEREFNNEN